MLNFSIHCPFYRECFLHSNDSRSETVGTTVLGYSCVRYRAVYKHFVIIIIIIIIIIIMIQQTNNPFPRK